jgi:hypothetical protein
MAAVVNDGRTVEVRTYVRCWKGIWQRIYVTLPAGVRGLFDQLVARKFYGDKHAEVARHLIIEKLDELVQRGRLKEE